LFIDHNPDTNSRADRKALAECPYLPFALAEAARFCKKYPGSFFLDELQSVAAEALLTSKKSLKYRQKAIRGALNDFAKSVNKTVPDIWVTEEKFARTLAGPPETNARLMAGPGKASSKYPGKVRVALGRSRYNDGWSQKPSQRAFARVDIDGPGDDVEAADPRMGDLAIGPAAPGGEVEVDNPNRRAPLIIRRHVLPPLPYIGIGPLNQRTPRPECGPGRRMWAHIPDLDGAQVELLTGLFFDSTDTTGLGPQRIATIGEDYGRPRKKSGFKDLKLSKPKLSSCEWHREADYLRWDDDKNPECWWGLPKWRDLYQDAEGLWRVRDAHHENVISEPVLKVPVRAVLICEEGAPSRPLQDPAALGGSPAGRAASYLPRASKPRRTRRTATVDRTAGIVNWQPAVATVQPSFA
jgi:hypothetical protein